MKTASICLLTFLLPMLHLSADEEARKKNVPSRAAQEAPPVKKNINTGLSYRSKYYWRGQWFYGASAGIFFPYVSYAKDGLYLYLGGEVGENLLFDESEANESGFGEVEEDWQGIDVGAVKTFELAKDAIDLSLGAWYFWYFKSPDIGNDGVDNSFTDLRASFAFKGLPLTPTLTYSHYLRSDDNYSEKTKDDYYVTLMVSKNFVLDPKSSLTLSGDINYWHYASQKESPLYGRDGEIPSGLSDAVIKSGFSFSHNNTTYSAGLNYAYVFDEKFDYTEGAKFDQHKFWTTFGIEKAF